MKKLTLTAILLFGTRLLLLGDTNPAAQQWVITARQQANIFQPDASPFQLDISFTVQEKVPIEGHLTLKWGSKERWWRNIVMSDFQQTDMRNGDKLYTDRNARFTPIRITQLVNIIHFAEAPEGVQVKKQKQEVEHGSEMTCLQVEGGRSRGMRSEVCLSPTSLEISSEEWKGLPDEQRRQQYAEYFEFRAHRYPRKLELFVNGSKVVTAHVDSLTTSNLEPGLLVPPAGAIERRQCEGMKHAVPLKMPDPQYPESARQNRIMGDTTVSMTVLADGSVSNIELIGSATHSMDSATLESLKRWKFKPAMCGTEPVISDIEVVVSFRLH
jgi:TonB family protein